MKDNWKEIVETLTKDIRDNTTENKYQDDFISCLKMLGWKTVNGSIRREVNIPIGNNNTIRPDIVLCKNEKILPIEIKRPSNICTERQEEQLLSYMRQLKSNVGIYVGNDIRFFYDDPNDLNSAICVFKIDFKEDDDNGITLCELLSFDTFDKEYFELFCKEQYDKVNDHNKLKDRLEDFFYAANVTNNIKSLIVELFVKEGFDKDEIEKELSEISIDINFNTKLDSYIPDSVSVVNVKNEIHRNYNQNKRKEKFSLDGNYYCGVGPFVRLVVNKYIEDHPNITFDELKFIFPDDLTTGSYGFVMKEKDFMKKSLDNEDIKNRFFPKPIRLYDNTMIVLNNQWGNNKALRRKFLIFLEHINKFYDYYCMDKKTNEVKYFPKK